MFKNKIFVIPKILHVDPGSEFGGVVTKYFEDNEAMVRVGKVGRSRMQAMAENRNTLIAKSLFQKQVGVEITTNKSNIEWVYDVDDVIEAINEFEKKAI